MAEKAPNPNPTAANGRGNLGTLASTGMILPVHPTPVPNTTLIAASERPL